MEARIQSARAQAAERKRRRGVKSLWSDCDKLPAPFIGAAAPQYHDRDLRGLEASGAKVRPAVAHRRISMLRTVFRALAMMALVVATIAFLAW